MMGVIAYVIIPNSRNLFVFANIIKRDYRGFIRNKLFWLCGDMP